MRKFLVLLLAALLLVGVMASPVDAARPAADGYTYRQEGYRITVTHICDDGTIVPGPHPYAIGDGKGKTGDFTISAHGVEKLDVAMQTYLGLSLTPEAKEFLYAYLPTVTCP